MKKRKGYLCEHCGQRKAKYETRSVIEGTNHLICEECFNELTVSSPIIHSQADLNTFVEEKI